MTEHRVGFLCNIASNLTSNNKSLKMLRSYYLMRCNELTEGKRLPPKLFSTKVRCAHCFLEWTKETEVKVKPLKFSKTQKKKIRSQNKSNTNNNGSEKNITLLNSNEMVQTCTFCKHSTTTQLTKPKNEYVKVKPKTELHILKSSNQKKQEIKNEIKKPAMKKDSNNIKPDMKKSLAVNIYSNAFDVFSLNNEKNTLSSSIKKPSKVIKNNKKKKDKFAGLCQKAVLASVKLKKEKETQTQKQVQPNKLDLFLKPSTG